MVVLHHARYVQVLNADTGWSFCRRPTRAGDCGGRLVRVVGSQAGYPVVQPGNLGDRLAPVLTALLPTCNPPLRPTELPQCLTQPLVVLESPAVRYNRQGGYAKVDPDGRAFCGLYVDLLVDLHGHEPSARPLGDCHGDCSALGRQVAAFLQPDPAELRQPDSVGLNPHVAAPHLETRLAAGAGFESRESELAVSVLPVLQSTEEVREGFVGRQQRIQGNPRRYLAQPSGVVASLQCAEGPLRFRPADGLLCPFILCLAESQRPVVDESGGPGTPGKGVPLLRRRGKLSFVGPADVHVSSLTLRRARAYNIGSITEAGGVGNGRLR
ncbi:MAG TPA: hypothetical protein VMY35_12090 [Phycisphaerae bacterium]|nr:hypothetical protein [Phycisphaerae bacterium]